MRSKLDNNFCADSQCSPKLSLSVAMPFYMSGLLLLAISMTGLMLVFGNTQLIPTETLQLGTLVLAALFVPMSLVFLMWPAVLRLKSTALYDFSSTMCEVNARLVDLETLRREHYKSRVTLESLCQGIQETTRHLIDTQADIESALRDRAAIENEMLTHRQELSRQRKQLKLWQTGLVEFYQLFERTLELKEELQPEYRRAIEKTLDDFSRLIRPLGLDPIVPRKGDEFNDRIHHALGAEESSSEKPGSILKCTKWGFRMGSTVLEPATVILASEITTKPNVAATELETNTPYQDAFQLNFTKED